MKIHTSLRLLPLLFLPALAMAQQSFHTPEEAANAFALAVAQ